MGLRTNGYGSYFHDPLLKAHSLDGSWKMAPLQGRDGEIMRKNQPAISTLSLTVCTSSPPSWIFIGRRASKEGNGLKTIAPKRSQEELGIVMADGEFSEMLFALLIAHSSFHHGAPPIFSSISIIIPRLPPSMRYENRAGK